MVSKLEQFINKALEDPKQNFFKKHKISNKNIKLIREAKEKKIKSKTLISKARKQNNNNKTLLGA